jgi:hypothetical protein
MSWSELQRLVPADVETNAGQETLHSRAPTGAGPFGVPDVGLPSLTWLSGDLATRARAGATSAGGYGLPESRFLQQLPGSLSFLDSAVDAGTRTVPPDVKVAVPPTEPLWRLGPGGGVAPGLRTPFGPVHAPRPFVGWTSALPEITHFDPQWGEPPMLPGLVWSTERLLYEPDTEGMRFAKGAQRLLYDHYVTMAKSQAYVQAYRQSSGTGSWAYRWVRAKTPLPTKSAPYEVLGPYARYHPFPGESQSGDLNSTTPAGTTASRPILAGSGRSGSVQQYLGGPARTLSSTTSFPQVTDAIDATGGLWQADDFRPSTS